MVAVSNSGQQISRQEDTMTIATRTPKFTWAKTQAGEWVVKGNATILRKCAKTCTQVDVTSRDGKVKYVTIDRVGKTFGDNLAYGYIADDRPARTTGRRSCITGGNCSSFGNGRSCGGHDCDGH